MRRHAVKLALAAGLIFAGAAHGLERDPITTGSISPKSSFGELDTKGGPDGTNAVGAGFGFSPFLEEGLVAEVPPARHQEFHMPVPAYLRDLCGSDDPL